MMAIVFIAFYIPSHHVGLSIFWPLMTVAVLVYPWLRQLFSTWAVWKENESANHGPEKLIIDENRD
jgi:hypothetical protein